MSGAQHSAYATPINSDAPAPAASFVWSDALVLGFRPMDETHEEFYRVAFGLLTCQSETMTDALEAFERHAVSHFAEEEDWMLSTEFPPRDCHIDEHAAVLSSVREVRAGVENGTFDVDTVHDLASHLFSWFPGHADYLDSALAAWMTKRTMGGKPIVIRRSIR